MPPNDINPESSNLISKQVLNTEENEKNDENKDVVITKQPEKTHETLEKDVKIHDIAEEYDCCLACFDCCAGCCTLSRDCWLPLTWWFNCCCDNQCCAECANSSCDGCTECLSGCGDCFVNCAQCCEA